MVVQTTLEDVVCEVCEVQNEQGLFCAGESWICSDCLLKFCRASKEPVSVTGVTIVEIPN